MSREIRSPVYQIDFTAVDAGKRIASTKRRIRWRFGFTNQDALAAGGTGTECRGEEHDITLIWSLTSGKRLVLADGQEVHYSNSRNHIFDFSWTMRGNHVLKVAAHANPPLNAHPNFRQYDFFVDGMSFFSMPKVYRLGLTDSTPIQDNGALALAHSSRVSGGYGNYSVGAYGQPSRPVPKRSMIAEIETPQNADEEEAYLKEAIKASLSEVSKEKEINVSSPPEATSSSGGPDLLIDFMSEPGPVPAPAPSAIANDSSLLHQPGVPQNNYTPYAIQQQPAYSVQSMPVANAHVAPMPMGDPFAAPPVSIPANNHGMSTTSSLASNSFAPSPFAAPPTVPEPAPMNSFPAPEPMNSFATPAPVPPAPMEQPPPVPEHAPNEPLTMAPKETGLGSDANDAFAKFANMDQFDLVKPKVQAENPFDAPVAATNAPSTNTTTLAGLKAANDQTEKKEVMKNNAMVISGAQNGNWGGYSNYGAPVAPGAAPMMGQAQPMMNQGGYGYPQQQYGAAPAYSQYGQPQQPMQQPFGQQPPPQQQAYGQTQFQQGYGQPQQF